MDGWLWMRRACRRAPMPPEKQIGAGTGSNLESWTHRPGLSVAYLRYNHEDVRLDAARMLRAGRPEVRPREDLRSDGA